MVWTRVWFGWRDKLEDKQFWEAVLMVGFEAVMFVFQTTSPYEVLMI